MLRIIISTIFASIIALFGAAEAKGIQTVTFCIAIAIVACCFGAWRAYITYRRISDRNQMQRMFTEHMRKNMRANRY